MYAILQAMGVKEGDEVILPAFTCVVVPNAIIYLKAHPVYVDIDPVTYNIDVEKVEAAITPRTRVLICQNTFGLSSNVDKLCEMAQRHNLYTIEDCTHGFGGNYLGKPNGTYCDAAFYSTQWNKPFSTGIGGFAFVSNPDLLAELSKVNQNLEKGTFKDSISLSVLYFVREKILTNRRYWKMVKLYRWLSKHKLVQGSSSGIEITEPVMPEHYFKGMTNVQIKKGIQTIPMLPDKLALRKMNAEKYSQCLEQMGKTYVHPDLFENHSFLKYPLLVKDREEVLNLAMQHCIPLGEWFCSPIHPVEHSFGKWEMDIDEFPVAKEMGERMVNLPTDAEDVEKVIQFIKDIEAYIL